MVELYWITRLSSIKIFFIFLAFIGAIFILYYLIGMMVEKDYDKAECENARKKMIRCIFPTVIVSFIAIFIPTTKEALIIYGIGGTIEYIKSNNTAKQLPDKFIDALDKYLDEFNNDNKED